MHDGLQLGTLVLVLFGILLTRYDFNALRKELEQKMDQRFAEIRKEMQAQNDSLRADINRQTTAINAMLFNHHERIAVIETKLENKQ